MSELLSAEFVERHVTSLPGQVIPDSWNLDRRGQYYTLDLKMCQLKTLDFNFRWGDDTNPVPRMAGVIETPSKMARLDVSLNELRSLPHDALVPFRNLRSLDASLNQVKYFQGIEVLRHLASLNLSHNNLNRLDGLLKSQSLTELNVSNNSITDFSGVPSLINLTIFNISNNKLESLDGVSAFPRLEEINASNNNLKDLVPLSGCLQLRVVSAGHNGLRDLDSVMRVLGMLRYLQVLNLIGNPIERDRTYQTDILRSNNLMTLDNVTVRPMPPEADDRARHAGNMSTLQDAARSAFEERMRVAKDRMEENVNFLQRRILAIQSDHKDFEKKLKADLDAALRYLSSLSEAEMESNGKTTIGASLHDRNTYFQAPDAAHDTYRSKGQTHRSVDSKEDYSNIKETDELLRCAFKELAVQKDRNQHI